MHQGPGSGPHHCSSVALIYYPVCLHSYPRPCPASPSIKRAQTHSGSHIHTRLPADSQHLAFLVIETRTYLHTASRLHEPSHTYLYAHICCPRSTLTCVVQTVNSPMLLVPVTPLHHCQPFFSSICSRSLIFILRTLSPNPQEYKCV